MEKDSVHRKARGPQGLGDPDDMKLRKIEKLVVEERVRKAAKEKCSDFILDFQKCAKESGLKLPFACRVENAYQLACINKWIHDEELNSKVEEEYLKQRREFRLTGVPKTL